MTETLGAEELAQGRVEQEEQEPGRRPAGHRKVRDSPGTKSGACLQVGGESLRRAHCGHTPPVRVAFVILPQHLHQRERLGQAVVIVITAAGYAANRSYL